MEIVTGKQYWEYIHKSVMQIREEGQTYQLEKIENKIYKDKKLNQIDKIHDKLFRSILSKKREMVKFLNQFGDLDEKIEEGNIEQSATDFVTRKYQDKHSDIIYKLKGKPIYFLLEHQSTIDKDMVLRLWEYIGEIVRRERNSYWATNGDYPIVVPFVIYTGYQKWNAKTNFAQRQYQAKEYEKYQNDLSYNLIAVQDYTFEELLEAKSLFSSFMMIEKCQTKEELVTYVGKIIEGTQNSEDRKAIAEMIDNIIALRVGDNIASEMLEKIKEKEAISMSPVTKMLLDLEIKGEMKGIIRGVKNMLQLGEKEEKIEKYMGITKEELENIKQMIAN